MEDTLGSLKFEWKIKNFSKQARIIYSDVFSLNHYKWRIFTYPRGDPDGKLSIFLEVADSKTLPLGWSRIAKFSFKFIDQINDRSSRKYGGTEKNEFDEQRTSVGFAGIPLKKLQDLKKGYLVRDTCIIKAHVILYEDASVESNGASIEASKVEPTTEDMDAFFGNLNSMIFPMKVASSEEEAKQALEIIEEALNMAPADLNNPGRMLQLKNTLDVLSLLDDCSILTSEQKAELLSMRDDFIGLPEQAANAVKSIKLFTEKDLVKKTLDQKLGKCLVGFEKAKAEAPQDEQNITILREQVSSLQAQIDEMEKKKENSLLKQKEMFKLSTELKEELDVLVKNLPEYEANMKAAEEEEKVVSTKWSKMKQFVLSLKPQSTLAKKPIKRS